MKLSIHAGRGLAIVLFSLSMLPAAAQLPTHLQVTVDKGGGEMVELNLSKYSIRSVDFRVQSWDSTNGYVLENPPVRTYRGYITQNPNELVTAIIDVDNTLDAEVHDGSGRIWTVSSVDLSGAVTNVPPARALTGIPATHVPATGAGSQALPGPNTPPAAMYSAHGVYDIPSSIWKGSVDATMVWLEKQWNIHDYFNSRDAKLNMLLTEVIVRKEQFYTPDNGAWNQFNSMLKTEWLAQGQNRRGFIASAFPTGFSYAGGYAVGNNFYNTGSEPIAINALYHENGHNWGASHWYYGQDTMSGSHPAHGEMNVMRVLNNRAREITEATPSNGVALTTNAVSLVHPYAFPDLATTLVDTPVSVNVLTNDWDTNGGALSIRYFTAGTVQGGSVSRSGNVLTYTPASGYVGKDIIVYQVEDDSGLYSQETVHIEVINQGLAASWSFEDASGQTATDGSGNGHAGTLSGASFGSSTLAGPVGNAIALASGQYMVCNTNDLIADAEVYPIDAGASNFFDPMDESFTAACWFKLKDTGTATLFDKATRGYFGYEVWASTSGLEARVRPFNGIGSTFTVSSESLQQGAWYHAAMVINRADHSLRLYLNGVEVGTAATLPADEFIFDGRDDLVVGGGAAVDLDEAQIHTKALSSTEILALYNAGDVPAGGPQPADGAVNQSLSNTVMEWLGNPSYQHNVYFGTDAAAVAAATTGSPEYQGQQAGTLFDPGTLDSSTTYFWRIDEVDGGTIIPGEVWSFSTAYSELLSDLVLHLTMDDDDVQTADGTTHTFDDIAVPAQDFEAIGAVPGATGIIGEAVDLTAADDTLRSYDINPVVAPATGGLTISFWINTTSVQSGLNQRVYDFGAAMVMYYDNGDLRPVFDGSSGGAITFDTNINDGNWHHIVARNDGAGTTTLFVDGVVAGTQSESLHDLASLGRTAALGSTFDNTVENLEALYDDFAVWQRSLMDSEVAVIHALGATGQTFNNEPVVVNTSFETTEGFTGFPAGALSSLGTVVDNDGVTWTELQDTQIWNRSDIPPAGIQTLTLGEGGSTTPGCTVQIPGTTHGVGLVSFDYASFSSGANTDFSLFYNDNAGSGWVEAWSTHMAGSDPSWTGRPWRTVEVGVYVPGNVDLKFEAAGDKGPMIDNVRITGKSATANSAPTWNSSPVNEVNAVAGGAYSATLSDNASDPDSNPLTYVKVSGPSWLTVAVDGSLGGSPGTGDGGPNSWTVAVFDGITAPVEETLNIVVDSLSLMSDDFERADGSTLGNGWIEETNDSRIYDTGNAATKMVISAQSADTPFAIVKQLTGTYTAGDRYELAWNAAKATSASGTLIYDVSIGTWNGAVFTPLATQAGSLGGLNLHGKTAGPSVYLTAMASEAGQQIAVRLEVVAGSDDWAGFDDIAVYGLGANAAPAFVSDPFSATDATEDVAYAGTISGSATDPNTGDTVTYSKVSGPAWLSVAADGALSGTPVNDNVGVNAFTVRATDAGGLTNDAVLNVTVINTNDDPAFTVDPISTSVAIAGRAYSDTIAGTAADIDVGDSLAYSKTGGPAWLTVAGNGTLGGTPTAGDDGPNVFTVQVDDGNGGIASATLNITVEPYSMGSRSYTENGTDFTGTTAGGAYIWGMDIDPINNVGSVDLDDNGTKDFHESGTTPVDPSDGFASNTDGTLFRWDYGGSPSRESGLETADMSYTLEMGLDIKSTGTEGSRGVFGLALRLTDSNDHGRMQMEIFRDKIVFIGGTDTTNVLTTAAATQSNVGYHTWRIVYDQTATVLFIYRDGVLLNKDGIGIPGTTNLGSPSQALIGDYSSGLSGDWELDYIVLDATGAYGIPSAGTPPDVTLGGPLGSGTDITLSWIGESGVSYGVQTNANLVDGIWNTYISGLVGDGGTITYTNDLNSAEMFFRIIVE